MNADAAVLILWDVDHTLVDAGGVGREMYAMAFERLTGRPLEAMPVMTGRTERAILVDTLALHGVTGVSVEDFFEALGDAAVALQDRVRALGRRLPGAREAIDALAGDEVVQSVATGNLRSIATVKLSAFDLTDGLDLEVGGYGSDTEDGERPALVRLARQRASDKYGVMFRPERVVVIGDTPHDVAAARATGARAVGVATGDSSVEDLKVAGADLVVADLSQTGAVVVGINTLLER